MNPDRYLLDTSALLTLIEEEPGAERVEEVIRTQETLLPWPILLELHYITTRERGRSEADVRHALTKTLPLTILWEMTEPILLTAAQLKATHPLSLADCLIAAYARLHQATLLHKDPEYEALTGELALEALPYKPRRT